MARKPSEEYYEELKKKEKILRERLAQSKSLIELIRSGELRPPQRISTCQFCLMPYKKED